MPCECACTHTHAPHVPSPLEICAATPQNFLPLRGPRVWRLAAQALMREGVREKTRLAAQALADLNGLTCSFAHCRALASLGSQRCLCAAACCTPLHAPASGERTRHDAAMTRCLLPSSCHGAQAGSSHSAALQRSAPIWDGSNGVGVCRCADVLLNLS